MMFVSAVICGFCGKFFFFLPQIPQIFAEKFGIYNFGSQPFS